jgi:hypothetical protein
LETARAFPFESPGVNSNTQATALSSTTQTTIPSTPDVAAGMQVSASLQAPLLITRWADRVQQTTPWWKPT